MGNNINNTGKAIALVSFVIGTCLLSFYLYFGESFIPFEFSIGFIITAFIVNLIVFIVLIGYAILNTHHRFEALKTCGFMLLNIPIAVLYFYIVLTFPNSQYLL